MQAVAVTQDLDDGQIGIARPLEPLGEGGGKGEAAAVGQVPDHNSTTTQGLAASVSRPVSGPAA